ncbi:MAG: PD-(D/E)XK nuclease family protein [Bacteroidales bacterium]
MTEIKSQLEEIQEAFKQEEHRTEKEFNIFNALYRKDNERFHSRFISYLLSSESKHGMKSKFLEAFIQVLSEQGNGDILTKFDFSNCIVRPNEEKKEEHEKIDILISNEKQAIVIENKIFAIDSYHPTTEEKPQHQLDTYCKKMKDGTNKEKSREYIIAIYLALNTRDPKGIKIEHKPLIKIDYQKHILTWIRKCIEITDNSFILKNILLQYESIIIGLTSNLGRATVLKKLIGKNIDIAWNWKKYICEEMGDFRHVKWLTINDFWVELAETLRNELKVEICKENDIEEITKVAHKENGSTGINFKLENGEEWYIVNDNINGLTFGKILPEKEEKQWYDISRNIKFTDFSNEDTFMLINGEKREDKIKEIINRLKENPLIKEPISIIL